GLFDHADDLRQHGVAADLVGAEAERAGAVDRAAGDGIALPFSDRGRLAGNHRLVDMRGAVDHRAVDRAALARTDYDDIADHDIPGRNIDRAAVTLDAGGPGLQAGELFDRRARPAAGAGLEQPAEEDQRDDDRRRLVIDVAGIFRQQAGREGGNDGIEIG